jgi:Spy/CpxP family protein refolding chaperone
VALRIDRVHLFPFSLELSNVRTNKIFILTKDALLVHNHHNTLALKIGHTQNHNKKRDNMWHHQFIVGNNITETQKAYENEICQTSKKANFHDNVHTNKL